MELVLLKNCLKRLKTLRQSSSHKSNHKAGCHPRSNNRAPFHDPKTSRSQTRPNWSENSRTARTSTLISRHRCCSLTKELPSSASLVNAYEILATARLEERANDARKEAKYRGCAFSTCTQARTTRKSLLEPTCSHLDDRSRFRVYMVRRIFWSKSH